MEKIIATFPCRDASTLMAFYQHLGFELVGQYTRGYLVFRYNELELHFYGSRMFAPQDNPSMCIIQTDNLEQLYDAFTTGLKANTGKIPRSGFPKISKIRDLSEDWRFTLADPSGNTIYVIQRKEAGSGTFFRDIGNEQYAEKFSVLYDLIYSKEDLKIANNLLPQLLAVKDSLGDMDKAKLLLLAIEIYNGLGMSYDDSELEILIEKHRAYEEWQQIREKYQKYK